MCYSLIMDLQDADLRSAADFRWNLLLVIVNMKSIELPVKQTVILMRDRDVAEHLVVGPRFQAMNLQPSFKTDSLL